MFGTINQGFRDNTALPNNPSGQAGYGMIAADDNGGGWEFHTHIADPGAVAGALQEFNVNFTGVFFGENTPFQKAHAVPNPGTAAAPGTINVAPSGVNSLTDGVLVAQVAGNIDSFAVATPDSGGAGWAVRTYSNDTTQTVDPVNWLYLPFTAQHLVAGRIAADGSVVASTGVGTNPGQFTLAKESDGSYLLTIAGKTPSDGTLLLTPEATAGVEDNLLVYEAAGNSFRIIGIDQVTADERQNQFIAPAPQDTSFTFAYIDYNNPPALNAINYLAADFNHDGQVNATDLGTWKSNFGTGTTNAQGDANGDSKVDGADFLVWQNQLGQLPTSVAAAGAVPEPAAAGLWLIAGMGLFITRRKRSLTMTRVGVRH
jgi:hypothetical protein